MKKGKLNNRGFVLVETLIVSVFVMGIFAILYNNFYPLMGEYEKRETYDDIDGKYATYWIKRVIEHDSVTFSDYNWSCLNDPVRMAPQAFKFNCDMSSNESMRLMCQEIIEKSQVEIGADDTPNIYITEYNLTDFKEGINSHGQYSGGMHKYVNYLPFYRVDSLNNAKYRVIVEFHRTKEDNDYLAYATFEVRK